MTRHRLQGKVAVVTGASQGLGQYLSRALAREGARVVLVARNGDRLATIAAAIAAEGGTALAIPTDLTQESACDEMIEATLDTFGSIDLLVLNAGSATYGRLEELCEFAPIRSAMEVNFFGAAYPTFRAIHHLIASKGTIVYVTSGSGILPLPGYLGYATSKHAMNGFFETLRLELVDHGVRVLAVNPGEMYNDDGAGRTVLGPDGSQHKLDLSPGREHDIHRVPASGVAEKVLDAIVQGRREIDLAPRIQKVASRARPFWPGIVDDRILEHASQMRRALDPELGDQRPSGR